MQSSRSKIARVASGCTSIGVGIEGPNLPTSRHGGEVVLEKMKTLRAGKTEACKAAAGSTTKLSAIAAMPGLRELDLKGCPSRRRGSLRCAQPSRKPSSTMAGSARGEFRNN